MVISSAYIQLKGAVAGYRKKGAELPVLSLPDFEFNRGELIALVGLNGTGKSTVLRSLSGLQDLLEGKILIDGHPVSGTGMKEISRKIAVVLTERLSGFNLRVWDVIAAGQMPYTGMFHTLSPAQNKIVENAALRCGVETFLDKPLHELSDGMFQKTMIAKALAQQTPAMLLDEPSAYLDFASRHQLFILLKELAVKDHKCIIVSTHDLDLALKYCNRLIVIHDKIAESIDPAMARQNEAFLKITGGFL